MSGQQGSNASYWPRRMSSTPPRDSYCLWPNYDNHVGMNASRACPERSRRVQAEQSSAVGFFHE